MLPYSPLSRNGFQMQALLFFFTFYSELMKSYTTVVNVSCRMSNPSTINFAFCSYAYHIIMEWGVVIGYHVISNTDACN